MQFSSVNCAQITRHHLQSMAVCCENLVYDVYLLATSSSYSLSGDVCLSVVQFMRSACTTDDSDFALHNIGTISVSASEHNVTASLFKLTNVIKLLSTCIFRSHSLSALCVFIFLFFDVVSFMFCHSFYFNFCFIYFFYLSYSVLYVSVLTIGRGMPSCVTNRWEMQQ